MPAALLDTRRHLLVNARWCVSHPATASVPTPTRIAIPVLIDFDDRDIIAAFSVATWPRVQPSKMASAGREASGSSR
jgi:hypothetical protein